MKIVIIGCGRVGRRIIHSLTAEGHDVTAVDVNNEVLEKLSERYDILPVLDNGVSVASQKAAGVSDSDIVIAATDSDEKNMLCCMVAKKLGTKRTIARVRNPQYVEHLKLLKEELGLSLAVNPEYTLANEIYNILRFPSALTVESFCKDKVEIASFLITPNCPLNGQSLINASKSIKTPFLICAVERGEELIIPRGSFVIQAGDKLYVTVEDKRLEAFFKEVGVYKDRPRKIMIVGGGLTAIHLAEKLKGVNVQIKIIEQNKDLCIQMEERLSHASIIHADAFSEKLLFEEGFESTDAFISLTGNDQTNSILALYAQECGIKKVITKIRHKFVSGMFDKIGLYSIVSKDAVTADKIIQFVRSLSAAHSEEIISLHKLFDEQGEAVEFIATKDCTFLDTPLKDVNVKEDIIVASIEHKGKIYLPVGSSTIALGDRVVVVTKNKYFDTLNDIVED